MRHFKRRRGHGRGPKTKKVLRSHAKRRAAERYGIFLGKEEQGRIVKDIQEGKATLLEKQSLRVSVWEVKVEGKIIPVCFDKKRQAIITCLPQEYMNNFI